MKKSNGQKGVVKESFGYQLYTRRKALGFGLQDVADRMIDVYPSHVHNWEKGIALPGIEKMLDLEDALLIPYGTLLGRVAPCPLNDRQALALIAAREERDMDSSGLVEILNREGKTRLITGVDHTFVEHQLVELNRSELALYKAILGVDLTSLA